MSDDRSATNLSPQESARVLALACTIASGALFIYLADHLLLGRLDPGYRWAAPFLMTSRAPILFKYFGPVLWAMWSGVWLLSAIDAVRNKGGRRVALTSLGVLVVGIVLTAMIHQVTLLGRTY